MVFCLLILIGEQKQVPNIIFMKIGWGFHADKAQSDICLQTTNRLKNQLDSFLFHHRRF